MAWRFHFPIRKYDFKGLSHQGCVLAAPARRPRKIQNAMVRAVGSPTAPWALRGIVIGPREDT